MKTSSGNRIREMCATAAAVSLLLLPALPGFTATDPERMNFDAQSAKIYRSYEAAPESYLAAVSVGRNLQGYYDLRQYPGSPPRIPHAVEPSFSKEAPDCLSCHEKGGFSPQHDAFIPVTPHPEKESCRQCHVPKPKEETLFVAHDWVSIAPPRLGVSALPSSPPTIPHSLQMREDCLSCHTGPAAVVEIRVEHADRGNCRQCHMPLPQTEKVKVFSRNDGQGDRQ